MKKVLVADDNPTNRELVRTVLERWGYEVVEAADGMEAVEKAAAVRPDLIILDLQMPRMDGFGVIRELRGNDALAGVPVMALTASAMSGDRERAMLSGFTGYITKPIHLSALQQEVERLLAA